MANSFFILMAGFVLFGIYLWWQERKLVMKHVVYVDRYSQDILDWLAENVPAGKFRLCGDTVDRPVYFKNVEDAVKFKLTFSDKLEGQYDDGALSARFW